ncbi:MAG: hypothetical protein KIT43_01465 [Bauldia sp.]|nr:hypothetical protein [Bauldia sp.]MCW5716203.1 hypothetical protein [Bauldia sp.]
MSPLDAFPDLGPETASLPGDDARARLGRAWEYHSAMDLLLQHRLNTFIVAQAFLAGAFFTSHVPAEPSGFLISARIALVVLAIAYSLAFIFLSARMVAGLDRLKGVLIHDPVFALYYFPGGKAAPGERRIRWLIPLIPAAALLFWLAVAVVGGVFR